MNIFTNFLRSLVLTIIFSFAAPLCLIGGVLLFLSLGGYVPFLGGITEAIANTIFNFLSIFGSGSALHGILVICLTCSFVGALFDIYVYYRYQILRLDS
ncbi:unknown protein [Nostoc sp. NIES-3756]|jgi:hypothetical protein|uniref:hypothetical protein n=1 Tax=Nostoc sp. NIES-3756 TaxID=1751286 RepID=UPI00071F016C|nr:hypothetical protein [Nostoc sp. NIES-3756]BAT52992.1 unknown protein [Nostoc sp. NIES-3756]BAY39286.1 hypothetical protein NIES2111_36600 [Nostoc sp. NIES-2111]